MVNELVKAGGASKIAETAAKIIDFNQLIEGKPLNVAILCATFLTMMIVASGYELQFDYRGGKASARFGKFSNGDEAPTQSLR